MKQISLLAATTPSSPAPGVGAFAGGGADDRACAMEPRSENNVPRARVLSLSPRGVCETRRRLYPPRVAGVNLPTGPAARPLLRDLLHLLGREDLLDLIDALQVRFSRHLEVGLGDLIELGGELLLHVDSVLPAG